MNEIRLADGIAGQGVASGNGQIFSRFADGRSGRHQLTDLPAAIELVRRWISGLRYWFSREGPSRRLGTAYGVDGCRCGWFYIALDSSGISEWGVVSKVEDLVANAQESDRIFVDIPIGLPEGKDERPCDKEARRHLGSPRGCSVFRTPVREALNAGDYEEAKQISRDVTGKAVTTQTFAIMPKILEVDQLLRTSGMARRVVQEVHPEICFWALAGERPMQYSKKKRLGLEERLDVLEAIRPTVREEFTRMSAAFLRRQVALDDIVDAMAAAITATADWNEFRYLPELHQRDAYDRPMTMAYAFQEAFLKQDDANGS